MILYLPSGFLSLGTIDTWGPGNCGGRPVLLHVVVSSSPQLRQPEKSPTGQNHPWLKTGAFNISKIQPLLITFTVMTFSQAITIIIFTDAS